MNFFEFANNNPIAAVFMVLFVSLGLSGIFSSLRRCDCQELDEDDEQ